mgnify:FL=1
MKLFRKLIKFLFIIILIGASICCIIGYSTYNQAVKEKPLLSRIEEITNKENYTKIDDLSKNYVNAVIAAEDHRFYDHGAIDIIGIGRAVFNNIKAKELQEGGSTITQQVAKNVVFSQEASISRKLGELFASFELEKIYSKDEILEIYVNTCYFGDGYYGIYDASYGYYKKSPKDLTLTEAAMLAGVPNAPSVYSPSVNPDLAKKRQKYVLNKMVEYGYINEKDINSVL